VCKYFVTIGLKILTFKAKIIVEAQSFMTTAVQMINYRFIGVLLPKSKSRCLPIVDLDKNTHHEHAVKAA